jgi:HEAT repeat protein
MATDRDALEHELRTNVDWRERRRAALELGYAGDPESGRALVQALDDPDPSVRQASILSLGRIGPPGALEAIAKPKILTAEEPEVRRAAVAVLGDLGGLSIVDAISPALSDPDWTVRTEAIAAVSRLVDEFSAVRIPETAKALVRLLPIADRDVREKTIRALGAFGRSAVSVLVDSLSVRSVMVRSGAAAALGLIQDPTTVPALVDLLTDESKHVRLAAVTALGNVASTRAIEPLIERLGDPDARVRGAGIDSLQKIGGAAVAPLIEALEHSHSETATASTLLALSRFSDDRALVPVLNRLGHSYMDVRWAAIDAAVAYGARAVPFLTEMLVLNRVPVEPLIADARKNPMKRNRLRTIRALGELKDPRAVAALEEFGQEDDDEIRAAVEDALAKIRTAMWARASAAKVLGDIGSPEAVPALISQLGDPNSTVRLRVVRALAAIGDARAARPLARLLASDADGEVRVEVANALGTPAMAGPAAVKACIRALSDESRAVRSSAARSLGRLASPTAAMPLVRSLGDSYWSVRRDAENSIMNLGARVVPPLIEALDSKKFAVRFRAARILGAIGDRRAIKPLEGLLEREHDESVRAEVEAALEAIRKA